MARTGDSTRITLSENSAGRNKMRREKKRRKGGNKSG